MSYVFGEIHTRQCCCTDFSKNFSCHYHTATRKSSLQLGLRTGGHRAMTY